MSEACISDINDQNFDEQVLQSKVPVLIDFWASWCGPCKMLAPVFSETAGSYQSTKIKFFKIDVEHNRDVPSKYNVRSIPTLLLFKDGEIIASKTGGGISTSQLKAFIDSHV